MVDILLYNIYKLLFTLTPFALHWIGIHFAFNVIVSEVAKLFLSLYFEKENTKDKIKKYKLIVSDVSITSPLMIDLYLIFTKYS